MEEEGEVNIVVDAAVVHGDREDVGVVLVEGGDGDSVAIGEGIDVVVASGPDSDPLHDDNDDDDAVITPSGSVRVTKVSASQQKKKEMTDKLYAAIVDFKADIFKSVRACAKAHDVSHVQLGRMLKDPELQYKGKGRASKVFTEEQEKAIVDHIQERMEKGCGMTILQVRIIQIIHTFTDPQVS